jgi:hydroxymethylpyrimidine pyrophosphatase-like HAD family hydrolase
MVAGDGANDLPMFFGAGRERGVIVGNAEEVIRENTTQNDPPFIDFS